jgi:hypothetical protein
MNFLCVQKVCCYHLLYCSDCSSSFLFPVLPVTEIWGLLALRLADDHVLPFDYQTYASQIQVYQFFSKFVLFALCVENTVEYDVNM